MSTGLEVCNEGVFEGRTDGIVLGLEDCARQLHHLWQCGSGTLCFDWD